MKKMLKNMNPRRALRAVGEWVGFWWMALLSLPEWAAEEREIEAEEEGNW